jgi:FkbM family methyltransferase
MSKLKLIAHRFLPARLRMFLTRIKKISYTPNPLVEKYKAEFLNRNRKKLIPDLIKMREGVEFRATERSRDAFEWFCYKSPQMVQEYDQFLEKIRGRQSFLDAGCSHGVFSLTFCASRTNGRALAIDPSPAAMQHLHENIALNGLENSILAIPYGVGASDQFVNMSENWDHLEITRGKSDAEVRVLPIDKICSENHFFPDIMKIDVEGFELDALLGAETTMSRHRPVLFLEIHPLLVRENKQNPTECFDFLSDMGYVVRDCYSSQTLNRKDFKSAHHTFFTICEPS